VILSKDPRPWSRLTRTKVLRAPSWLLNRLRFRGVGPRDTVSIRMKLGHRIELAPTQDYLYRVLLNRTYHDDSVEFLARHLKPGSVILDVGANIGLVTCAYAQRLAFLGPRIYAFEAVARNFERLRRNVALNRFEAVMPLRLALGDRDGELTFHLPDPEFSGNAVGDNVLSREDLATAETACGHVERVPLRTLDGWARDQGLDRCDFMKIDVEGAELNVLRGGASFIGRTRPVVQCEFNRYWLAQQGLGIDDYLAFFAELGYDAYVDAGHEFVPLAPAVHAANLVDLLFYPRR
jgi:FkbM family methyltransferase